jgi:hypothetical protein
MAGKRGLAYVCTEDQCDWIGEKGQAVTHYVKNHCTSATAPYSCTACNFLAGSLAQLEKHRISGPHKKTIEKRSSEEKHYLRYRKNEEELQLKFRPMTSEESKSHFDI